MPYEEDQDYIEGSRRSLRDRKKRSHTERKLRGKSDELKFLEHFDPVKSNREKRKLRRKPGATSSKNSLYDEYGRVKHNKADVCDCMDEECNGCWFECESCMGTKCGIQCRVNRKFFYDCITFDGKDATIKNKHF
ncbi:ARL14 effector protein [Episyrphus balteatus]|uniref:ARL14 effector protein n=1 Tax=Episyrphus balteatus TaxID=286459 RepID=UPI0024853730|nr:ARL14 effector protein [Episyrphus balteatus]